MLVPLPLRRRSRTLAAAALTTASLVVAPHVGTPADAAQTWAPADEASIHPGVQTYTSGSQCTTNFVFTSSSGDVYIGQAAHCSGTGGSTETNGCNAGSLPLGTEVEVAGATQPGRMVYNSWITMQEVGETDPDACAYNDFALIELDPADHGLVNPSVPFWGGPMSLGASTPLGSTVYTYGNSSLRLGLEALSPKTGASLGDGGNGWTHTVYTATPGIPGDSGSAFLDASGNAVGVLSTVALAPLAGSNGVSDLRLALEYLRAHTSLDVTLVPGTVTFSGL